MMKPRTLMCDDCPFGNSARQRAMRQGLKPGRFAEIGQSIWAGVPFPCHKTTNGEWDEDGIVYVPSGDELECAGAIAFGEKVSKNRSKAQSRAEEREK